MAESPERLFLIDGSALVYRAYFAFIRNPLITRKGEHTSAVYGFVNSLLKLMHEEKPTHLAVIWDTPKPTFRHKLYPDYKATRAKMPDDMIPQLGRLREVLEVMGIRMLQLEGFEADDLIGTMARESADRGIPTVLVSGDKDYMQLVNEHVSLLNPKRAGEENEWLDSEGVEKKFGVPPEQVIEVLALAGDSSDNVPGVAGVGPKTAVKLIQEYGSVQKLYDSIDAVSTKGVREKLQRDKEKALLSRELVTIDTAVPITWELAELEIPAIDVDRIEALFRELEFTRLLSELRARHGDAEVAEVAEARDYRTVTSTQDLKDVAESIRAAGVVALDTETTGLDPHRADLVGLCLSWREAEGVYIPVAHTGLDTDQNAPLEAVQQILLPVLRDERIRRVAHHGKYDGLILQRAGLDLPGFAFDTMLAAYLLDPSGRHGLDALSLELCGQRLVPIEELIGKGKKQKSFAEVPIDTATYYAAEDADFTLRLFTILEKQIRKAGLEKLLYEVEQPLVPVLMKMEQAGVALDVALLAQQSEELGSRLDAITEEIESRVGHSFNINSTQQLQKVLFEELKLPPLGKTAKGTGYSTAQSVLEQLAQMTEHKGHEVAARLLEYRELSKLKSTYIDTLPKLVDEQGRVHTSYNQTVAATGRLSSQDPNLQNIPIRTDIGRQIRRAFVARDPDHRLLAADYSQVELRILAHVSGDDALKTAFSQDVDVHRRTAAAVYDVSPEDVTRDMRAVAKTANFAIIYGVSAFGLAQQTDLTVGEAKEFIETYFLHYPGVKRYMDETIQSARDTGYVSTLLGRRRFLPEITAENRQRREFAERTAINTPIQGTAADLIKVAMINIHGRMADMRSRMVLQVHDELVFDAHTDELESLSDLVRFEMEHALDLDVPLTVDMGVGTNWLEAK